MAYIEKYVAPERSRVEVSLGEDLGYRFHFPLGPLDASGFDTPVAEVRLRAPSGTVRRITSGVTWNPAAGVRGPHTVVWVAADGDLDEEGVWRADPGMSWNGGGPVYFDKYGAEILVEKI